MWAKGEGRGGALELHLRHEGEEEGKGVMRSSVSAIQNTI